MVRPVTWGSGNLKSLAVILLFPRRGAAKASLPALSDRPGEGAMGLNKSISPRTCAPTISTDAALPTKPLLQIGPQSPRLQG